MKKNLITERIKVHKGEKGKRQSRQAKWDDFSDCPYCGSKSYFSMSITDGLKGRGRIKVCDELGHEIDTDYQAIALYYCPNCYKFNAKNNIG